MVGHQLGICLRLCRPLANRLQGARACFSRKRVRKLGTPQENGFEGEEQWRTNALKKDRSRMPIRVSRQAGLDNCDRLMAG